MSHRKPRNRSAHQDRTAANRAAYADPAWSTDQEKLPHGNLDTPIRRFLTHPNQNFDTGDRVIYADPHEYQIVGVVLGRIETDRVLVDWNREIKQEDVEDLIKVHGEWSYKYIAPADVMTNSMIPKTMFRNATRRALRIAASPDYAALHKQAQDSGSFYNQFKDPTVQSVLKQAGMHDRIINQFAGLLDNMHTQTYQQLQTMAPGAKLGFGQDALLGRGISLQGHPAAGSPA